MMARRRPDRQPGPDRTEEPLLRNVVAGAEVVGSGGRRERNLLPGNTGCIPELMAGGAPGRDGKACRVDVTCKVDRHSGRDALYGRRRRQLREKRVKGGRRKVRVARRHHHRLVDAREIPQAGQRLDVLEQRVDDAGEEAHLHVGVRSAHPVQIELAGTEEDVVGADRAVGVGVAGRGIGRVALARVGRAESQVERPSGRARECGPRPAWRRWSCGPCRARPLASRRPGCSGPRPAERQGHVLQARARVRPGR